MKKALAFLLAMVMLLSLTACSGGEKALGCEGKYVSVAATAMGITLTGEDAAGFVLDLEVGGKGTCTIDGESENLKWSLDGSKITVTIDDVALVGEYSKDQLEFKDFLGMGMDCLFAIEGSAAADAAAAASSENEEDVFYPVRFQAISCEKDGEEYEYDEDYVEFTDDEKGVVCCNGEMFDITWIWYDDDTFEFTDEMGDTFEGVYMDNALIGTYCGYDFVYDMVR